MTQWYYADDARNRIGPISAEELREHYRQRRLRRDSLVWCDGMVQWLPLERLAIELDIDSITPDAALPPPLPSQGASAGQPSRPTQPVHAAAPKKGMSGCLIALLVCAVVAVPMLGILAAIALPAYNDYVQRAKVAEAMASVAALKLTVTEFHMREGRCPDNDSSEIAPLVAQLTQSPRVSAVRVGSLEGGRCAFEITLRGLGAQDGKTILFEASEDASQWDCSGGDLPARYRPMQCRPDPIST
jgi:type IV pilus assembly protein PilA